MIVQRESGAIAGWYYLLSTEAHSFKYTYLMLFLIYLYSEAPSLFPKPVLMHSRQLEDRFLPITHRFQGRPV